MFVTFTVFSVVVPGVHVIGGENISIIDLRIPYVNEESYKERMSAYIDETASEADSLRENDEKLIDKALKIISDFSGD